MTIINGRVSPDDQATHLAALLADAKEYFGEDLEDGDESIAEAIYSPVAILFAEFEQELANVLDSAQIDHAEGAALDFLTASKGVARTQAVSATGTARFSRATAATKDYPIPAGTIIQTTGTTPTKYTTDASAVLDGPETSTDVTTYSETSGTFVSQTAFSLDVTNRNTIDVQADIRTTDEVTPITASLEIADATNATILHSGSTTSGTFVTSGPTTYDVSGLSGTISIEYRLKSSDGVTAVELTNADAVLGGELRVDVAVTASVAGVNGNVGANTLTVMPSAPSGVESVTNPAATSGGAEEETDDELRTRAKVQLSEGSASTPDSIITAIQNLTDVKSVSAFWNDQASTDADGMPPHSGEVVVQGGNGQEIAQTIMNKKAWGDTFTSGIHGTTEGPYTVTLVNDQTHELSISRPTEVKVYVDATLTTDSTYEGNNAVFDAIVTYIGGLLSTGSTTGGLGVGDDVLIGEVEAAIRGVGGVYDVTNIAIDTTASPTATTNITITDGSVATSDATDGSLTLTTNAL